MRWKYILHILINNWFIHIVTFLLLFCKKRNMPGYLVAFFCHVSQLQCKSARGVAAEPRCARRGRCWYIRTPDSSCPAAASGEKDWRWRPGPGPHLHFPVQPAGGSPHFPTSPTRHNFCVGHVTQTDGILFVLQVVKILTHYTPHGDLDERVTLNFIRTVQVL